MRLFDADAIMADLNGRADYADMLIKDIKEYIAEQPTIDAAPVIHAHWNQDSEGTLYCSKCGRPTYDSHDVPIEFNGIKGIALVWPYYCGFCGSKMDEEKPK